MTLDVNSKYLYLPAPKSWVEKQSMLMSEYEGKQCSIQVCVRARNKMKPRFAGI